MNHIWKIKDHFEQVVRDVASLHNTKGKKGVAQFTATYLQMAACHHATVVEKQAACEELYRLADFFATTPLDSHEDLFRNSPKGKSDD